jgi:hypothetical protein
MLAYDVGMIGRKLSLTPLTLLRIADMIYA